MKTMNDLEKMKDVSCPPFNNAYEWFMESLEDCYISKLNGKDHIIARLEEWDEDAQKYIIQILISNLNKKGFNKSKTYDLTLLVSK